MRAAARAPPAGARNSPPRRPRLQMLVDDIGDVTVTNDGATILKLLEVEHPAAKVRPGSPSGHSQRRQRSTRSTQAPCCVHGRGGAGARPDGPGLRAGGSGGRVARRKARAADRAVPAGVAASSPWKAAL